jgi:two-component system sensor histidine kinase UhpB
LEVAQVAAEFNAMLDARAQVERALRNSETRLRLVIDQLPMMLWTTDSDLRFTSSLGKGFQSVNVKPNHLAGRSLFEVLNTTDPQFPAIEAHRQALKGQSAVYELDWAGHVYESHVEPMRDDQGNIIGCIGVALDITERKQAEAALRTSKERFQAMIENSSDGIVLMTADGTITYASPGATRLSGFAIEQGSSLNRFDLIHPDDLEQLTNEWSTLLQQPGSTSTGVYRVRYKDGSWHWVERVLHNLLSDPSVGAIVSNYRDISERKQAEDALRQYAMRLVDAQEAARRQLAHDLHDQVGTLLTALGINLNVLRSELSSRAAKKVGARLTDSAKLLDEAQDRIRGVMTDLYPAVLDDYGLEAALHWYAGQFSNRVGLEIDVHSPALSPRLSTEIETGLFRITQEALTNVAKHARARHVTIALDKLDGTIRLTIADDGIGFNPAERREPVQQRGLGLVSMRERAESLGGNLRIEAAPDKGTQVIVEVPR